MPIADDLLRFIRSHRDELTLSVYVEPPPADPAARRDWRVRLRQGLNDVRLGLAGATPDERDAFEDCAAEILSRLPPGALAPAPEGWACFAAAGGETVSFPLAGPVETSVRWGLGVRVVPYLRAITGEDALIVLVDRAHARIARWSDGALHDLWRSEVDAPHDVGTHMGDSPRRGFHDGTRGRTNTDEEQRQRIDASDRLLAELQEHLATLVAPHEPVLIGGAAERGRHLLSELPANLAVRSALVPSLDMKAEGGTAASAIRTALASLRQELCEHRVHTLREEAHTHGRAAVGYARANRAAEIGAIAELIVSEEAWREHPEEIEALVQRALGEGADVSCAVPSLAGRSGHDTDGVIAGLRFPLPEPW